MSAAPQVESPSMLATHRPDMPPVQRREVVAWAFFDFANSGYTTVVITAVFNAFFVSVIANKADWATLAWTAALSLSYLLNMITSPFIGAYADLRARKRGLLIFSTVLCVLGTVGLAFCGPGDVAMALTIVVIGNFAFGMGENLIAAFLPELVKPEAMGKISGWGWGLGYLGGLLTLGICLWWIQSGDRPAVETVPTTLLITAGLFALAVMPTMLLLRERARPQAVGNAQIWSLAKSRVLDALRGGHGLLDLRRFLWCIVAYQAGVQTVIALAAIYTEQALGFTVAQSIQLILLVNITAAIGAFLFGWLQDRFGHRPMLAVTLVGWLIAVGLLWASSTNTMVWIAANVAGLCLGASQSAGRALVGYLCPPEREAEIFGLWGLAVKFASILGPLSYGIVNKMTDGDHRLSIAVTAVFFIAGLVLLMRVNVARGHAAAHAGTAAHDV